VQEPEPYDKPDVLTPTTVEAGSGAIAFWLFIVFPNDPHAGYRGRSASTNDLDITHGHKYTVHMKELKLEWDKRKDKTNVRKHGISFEEARMAFYDENGFQFFDPDHSEDEDRFLFLGMSFKLRVLVVCHCFRESETVVRIISARKADKEEERDYWRRR